MKKENLLFLIKRFKNLSIAIPVVIAIFSITVFANTDKNIYQESNNESMTLNPDSPDYLENINFNPERIEILHEEFKSNELYYIPELDGIQYYSIDVKYIYKDSSQNILRTGDVIWKSSDDNVAEVRENGTVIPKSEGTVVISAEYNGLHDSIEIKVKEAGIKKLEIVESGLYQRSILAETLDGKKYDVTDNKDTHWKTSDESLATVETGNIRLKDKKSGNVALTATFKGVTATIDINVINYTIVPEKIKLSKNQILIEDINGCYGVSAKAEFPDGGVKNISDIVAWESENPDVASVHDGRIYAVSEGDTTIDVSYMEFHDIIKVTVKQHDNKQQVMHPLP